MFFRLFIAMTLVLIGVSVLAIDESQIAVNSLSTHQLAKTTGVSQASFFIWVLLLGIIIFGLIWVLRNSQIKFSRKSSHVTMKVINWLPLNYGHHLAIVQIGSEFILVAVGKNQVSYIKTLTIMEDEWLEENFERNLQEKIVSEIIKGDDHHEEVG